MRLNQFPALALTATLVSLLAPLATAQPCTPAWSADFSYGDFDGAVRGFATFDIDGAGGEPPRLFATGDFKRAGGQAALRIAQWDGASWQPVGGGLDNSALVLLPFDPDAAGPQPAALYVMGNLDSAGGVPASRIAKWDGAAWSAAGPTLNGTVSAATVFDDDGPGARPPAIYIGGTFNVPTAPRIARLEAGTCVPLGSGGVNDSVSDLLVSDLDGSGPAPAALYAGGSFTTVSGVAAARVARWNGSRWAPLGSGMNNSVVTLAEFDPDGPGPATAALYAGGTFTAAGGQPANQLARWDGSVWTPIGGSPLNWVEDLLVSPGGSLLVATRVVENAGRVLEWDGVTLQPAAPALNDHVMTLHFHDDGGGARLYAGGTFTGSGGIIVRKVARLDGEVWTPLGPYAVGHGMDDSVYDLEEYDPDGTGPLAADLIAAGIFGEAGGVAANGIAAWDGSGWRPLGAGAEGSVHALTVFPASAASPSLIAGGGFARMGGVAAGNIAAWNGTDWAPLGGGTDDQVSAVCGYDSDGAGPASERLVAGGWFAEADGLAVGGIAAWDGTSWAGLGSGVGPVGFSRVEALSTYDPDGAGPAKRLLVAGGAFTSIDGVAAKSLATWDGASWAPLGFAPTSGGVYALAEFDEDGTGPSLPSLFAGGWFALPGTGSARLLARWNGTDWSIVGQPMNGGGNVTDMLVAPEGLYVGGGFPSIGGVPHKYVARWDGAAWHALDSGVGQLVYALALHRAPGESRDSLYAGGVFTTAGGQESFRIAQWGCTDEPCYPDCNSDGVLNLADFGCFQTEFALGHVYADCNTDGALNLGDFGCFQTKFALGCP